MEETLPSGEDSSSGILSESEVLCQAGQERGPRMVKEKEPAIIHFPKETLVVDFYSGRIARLPKAAAGGCSEVHDLAVELLRLAYRPRQLPVPANDNCQPANDNFEVSSIPRNSNSEDLQPDARTIWKEKLTELLKAEAIVTSVSERFQLRYLIKEAVEMLARLPKN